VRRLAFALFLLLPITACGQPARLEVKDVWARDTVGSTANAAVFMTISSPTPDRLIAASTPIAEKTDLMTMAGGSGAMEMQYLDGIDIPANKPVSLNSSGLHVWLADLNQPLRAGQSFQLTLKFEKAGERRITVTVISPAAAPVGDTVKRRSICGGDSGDNTWRPAGCFESGEVEPGESAIVSLAFPLETRR
jgi:copper(I)-binding protein